MIDIEDLVEYLYKEGKIRRHRGVRGRNIQITCPRIHYKLNKRTGEYEEHLENRPSLGISLDEPYLFHCFSCGFRGTIEFLVAELLDIDVMEAVRWLSNRYEFDENSYRKLNEKAIARIKDYEELFGEKVVFKEYPESYFLPFRQIHRYTLDRGLSEDIARKYEIGFDKWQRRIVMPVRSDWGTIVGLYGRAIDEENEAKYLYYNYTDEMQIEGFDKSLFIIKSKGEDKKDIAVVVESGLDVPWADQNGLTEYADVISILGSKISPTQASKLSRYKEIVIGLDNDFSGEQGKKLMIKMLGNITRLSFLQYPKGVKDLGECDKDQMIKAFKERKSVLQESIRNLQIKVD